MEKKIANKNTEYLIKFGFWKRGMKKSTAANVCPCKEELQIDLWEKKKKKPLLDNSVIERQTKSEIDGKRRDQRVTVWAWELRREKKWRKEKIWECYR